MFKIGDHVVCPGHGVGHICDIEERDYGGDKKSFYTVEILSTSMTIMVPTDSENGIRPLVKEEDVQKVYNLLRDHNVEVDQSTWNRRSREYLAKIKTGSLEEIAEVLRELLLLKTQKNLSFGEKKMLDHCKNLLVEEISLLKGNEAKHVNENIDSCFNS